MSNLMLKQTMGMYQVMVYKERLTHKEAIFDLKGNQKSKWWMGIHMINEEYYLVDHGTRAIFHIDNPDEPVSKWWGYIVFRSTPYYLAVDMDTTTNYIKHAIFHVDDPEKPISKWWDEILPIGLVNGESPYYLARIIRLDHDEDLYAIFHVDDPEKPVSGWWININAYDFLTGRSQYYRVQREDYFTAVFRIVDKKEEQVTEWEDIIETNPPLDVDKTSSTK